MLASFEVEEDEVEDEDGPEGMTAVTEGEIGTSIFETVTETSEAENASERESGIGGTRGTLGCVDRPLVEHDHRPVMRETFETVSGIYPQD